MLQMRESGRRVVNVLVGLVQEDLLKVHDRPGNRSGPIPHIQAKIGGDLIVAASPGSEFAAKVTESLD